MPVVGIIMTTVCTLSWTFQTPKFFAVLYTVLLVSSLS
jgi:hypothetical protein